ncbi:MAG: helix-turn-helix domain-containing protein [Maritimibacter sp.]
MTGAQVKSIRALARGLEVLRSLQTLGPMTLHALHKQSNIPKASLLRILKTLMEQGLVWQRMLDDAYVPSFSLAELAGRLDRESALVELASPVLKALSDEIQWPSVLTVPRLTHMEVLETNVAHSYFDNIQLGPPHFAVNMLRSASGRAFVAFCEPPVREAVLDKLRSSDRKGDLLARNDGYVERLIEETRGRGFGLRDPDFGGDFDEGRAKIDDGRDSLAVPIKLGQHVPGTINITWAKRAFGREKAVALLANPALRAAAEIEVRMSRGKV